MGSETRIEHRQDAQHTSSPGISPLLILFFISGMAGLGIAAAVLLANDHNANTSSIDNGPAQVVDNTQTGIRVINDWQADDFTLNNLDGEPVTLSDYRGRVVFMNLWRTDCAPCVREMPALADFQVAQGDEGAVVLAVNQGEAEEDVRAFLSELGVTGLPVLLDYDMALQADYPVPALPVTYLIRADGYVAYSKYGELTSDKINEYYALLESEARG